MATKKQERASVLAVTVIILGLILTIALGASVTSVLERKASIGSNKSSVAYQKADAGIEKTLKLIDVNKDGKIAAIDTDCDGKIEDVENNYKVELKDKDGLVIAGNCDADIADIRWVKSVGTADQNQRVVEVAVAANDEIFDAWDTTGFSVDNVYQAEADGFVVAYGEYGNLDVYTDGNNPPVTQILRSYAASGTGSVVNAVFPVKKGDYWRIVGTSLSGTVNIGWLPVLVQ